MTRKKTTLIFVGTSIVMIGILIISYKVITKFHHINQNKGEDIIEQHQNWMRQVITASDTIPNFSKKQIDSINKIEFKRDSLLNNN